MNFVESVRYLYGLGNEVLTMKLGLDNIRALRQIEQVWIGGRRLP